MADQVYKVLINDKMTDISELKVTELKAELKKRGVSTTGCKSDLYEKLKNYLIKNPNNSNFNTSQQMNSSFNSSQNNISLNTTQSDLETSKTETSRVEINESLPLKRVNDGDDSDALSHKKVKHVVVEPPPPQPVIVEQIKPVEPAVVVENNNNNNNEMELSINKSRSNSIESQSPTRSMSTRSPSPSSRSRSRSNSVLNNNTANSVTTTNNAAVANDVKMNEEDTSKSKSPSSISNKSESVIKEVPMSGDRNRFSRSRSPKSRWHASPTPDPVPGETTATATTSAPPVETQQQEKQENSTETQAVVDDAKKNETKADETQSSDMPKIERKRRWFTNTNDALKNQASRSLSISSDTLKTYLPEAKIPKTIDVDVLSTELEATSNETVTQAASNDESVNTNRKVIKSDQNDDKYVQRQPSRTVIIEENNELIYEDALTSNDLNKSMTETTTATAANKKLTQSISNEGKPKDIQHQISDHIGASTDEPERVGDVSPAREPESTIIHVKGLTRPFTLPQLKELLSKYGKIVDSKFWIDNVKSHCYASYETIEEAKLAREGLHRTKWPQSNPKVLRVDFATEEEFVFHQNGEKAPISNDRKVQQNSTGVNNINSKKDSKVTNSSSSSSELKSEPLATNTNKDKAATGGEKSSANRSGERDREREGRGGRERDSNRREEKDANKPIREWDLPKLKRSRSRSRDISMERRRKNQEKRLSDKKPEEKNEKPKEEEPPAKVLEDIFRKTNATPYIYWLPLTDEEITARALARQQRMEERERRRQEEKAAAESKLAAEKENAKSIEPPNINTDNAKRSRSRSHEVNGRNGEDDHHRYKGDDKPASNGRPITASRSDDRSYRSSNQSSSRR